MTTISNQIKSQMLKLRLLAERQLKAHVLEQSSKQDEQIINLLEMGITNPIVHEDVDGNLNTIVEALFISSNGELFFIFDISHNERDVHVNDAEIDMDILLYLLESFEKLS